MNVTGSGSCPLSGFCIDSGKLMGSTISVISIPQNMN
jgi:hypothetical protein